MKTRHLLIYLLLLPITLFASNWSLETGGAWYRPHNKSLKNIYTGGWIDLELEAAYGVGCNTDAWIGLNWISKKHNTHHAFKTLNSSGDYSKSDDKKQLWILPISLGAKYFFYLTPRLSLYVGGGPAYTFVKAERHAVFRNKTFSKQGLGAVIQSGIRYDWGDYTFVNLFCNYFHQNFHLSHTQRRASIQKSVLDLSGWKIGLSLGVYF